MVFTFTLFGMRTSLEMGLCFVSLDAHRPHTQEPADRIFRSNSTILPKVFAHLP